MCIRDRERERTRREDRVGGSAEWDRVGGREESGYNYNNSTRWWVTRSLITSSKEAEPVCLKSHTAGVLKCDHPWTGGAGVCEVAGHLKR